MRILLALIISACITAAAAPQQTQPTPDSTEKAKTTAKEKREKKEQPTQPPAATPEKPSESAKPGEPAKSESADGDKDKDEHFDVNEVAPVITHHQITVNGKALSYSATTGRLPLKRGDGKIEAEMFFVAYTLDGQAAGTRPLTFAFNGGPGSASVWL